MCERPSYIQSNEERRENEWSRIFKPARNLVAEFAQTLEEEELQSEHLKVYLRVRPLLSEESIKKEGGNVEILNKKSVILTAPCNSQAFKSNSVGNNRISRNFTFTHVYDESTDQQTLFEETTQNLVQDVVNGQNCLLFSYGATNSGKTFTIQGSENENRGLLPRSLDHLFRLIGDQQYLGNDLKPHLFCNVVKINDKQIQVEEEDKSCILKSSNSMSSSMESSNSKFLDSCLPSSANNTALEENLSTVTDYSVQESLISNLSSLSSSTSAIYAAYISFAEIYNEQIFDLLEVNSLVTKASKKSTLVLGEDRHGSIYIKGLKEIRIRDKEEALKVLQVGKANLHFAATKLNHKSSRSHCVFTIKLIRLADMYNPHIAGVSMFSICDLAGAERTSKTLNTKDRLKESGNINTSLLVLGRCMMALRHNQSLCGSKKNIPVPYRDSKITRIFQSFFVGRGKISMIVNVAFSSSVFDETLKVLKFSALASKVVITQERPQLTAESFVTNIKPNNKFSRFVRQSLEKTTDSNRFSIPWANKSGANITFGDSTTNNISVVLEEDEEEENEIDEEHYIRIITLLKEKLLKECREKAELETKLRKEICDAFSKRIVQIEQNWESRLQEEKARKEEELMEWRLKHLTKSLTEESRKRAREDSDDPWDDDQEMVPAIHLVREENRAKDLEFEKNDLNEEIKSLKTSLKAALRSAKEAQEEKSHLLFEMANMKQDLIEIEEQKMNLEKKIDDGIKLVKEDVETRGKLDLVVIDELKRKNDELKKNFQDQDLEIKKLKEMLMEAAEDYRVKEKVISSLTDALDIEKKQNSRQIFLFEELEGQHSETKAMLDKQTEYIEERETQIEEIRCHLKQISEFLQCSNSNPQVICENLSKFLMEEKKRNEDYFDELKEELIQKDLLIETLRNEKSEFAKELAEMQTLKKTILELEKEIKNLQTENLELKDQNEMINHESVVNSSHLKEEIKALEKRNCDLVTEHEGLEHNLRNCVWELEQQISDLKKCIAGRSEEIKNILKDHEIIGKSDESNTDWTFLINKLKCYSVEIEEKYKQSNVEIKAEKDAELVELKDCISHYEDSNSKFKLQQEISEQELYKLKENVTSLETKIKKMREDQEKSLANQKLIFEQKVAESNNRCQILEKELAAIRLARSEEGVLLRNQLEVKESEISSLEQELKKKLLISTSVENPDCSSIVSSKIKKEGVQTEMVALQETLKFTEAERDDLKAYVLRLQNQIEEYKNKSSEDLPIPLQNSTNKCNSRNSPEINSFLPLVPIWNDSSVASEEPASNASSRRLPMVSKNTRLNTKSTRSSRMTKKLNLDEFNTPERMRLMLDSSDLHVNSAAHMNRTKKANGKENSECKIKSSRKKKCLQFQLDDEGNESYDDEDDNDDTYYMRTSSSRQKLSTSSANTRSTKARGRTRGRQKSHQIFNPHITGNENQGAECDISKSDNVLPSSKATKTITTRSRGRRPLYSNDTQDQLEQSPQLLGHLHQVTKDSPHSIVRRNLRSKK